MLKRYRITECPEPFSEEDSRQQQAEAWEAVFATLEEVAPDWRKREPGKSKDWACDAIRKLAAAKPVSVNEEV